MEKEELWQEIARHAGETFFTKKGLPFSYAVRGGEMFVDRREKTITRSTFEKAYDKLQKGGIYGPKALGMYGAPYIWGCCPGLERRKKSPQGKTLRG